MTERSRTRRPGPALVVWSSVALFAMLFALLTYQLASSQQPPPRPVLVRQIVKRRVVTTVLPTPGQSTVTSSGGQVTAPIPSPGPAPVTTGAS